MNLMGKNVIIIMSANRHSLTYVLVTAITLYMQRHGRWHTPTSVVSITAHAYEDYNSLPLLVLGHSNNVGGGVGNELL